MYCLILFSFFSNNKNNNNHDFTICNISKMAYAPLSHFTFITYSYALISTFFVFSVFVAIVIKENVYFDCRVQMCIFGAIIFLQWIECVMRSAHWICMWEFFFLQILLPISFFFVSFLVNFQVIIAIAQKYA